MALYYSKQCFFDRKKREIIDFIDKNGKSQVKKESLELIQERYPDATIIESDLAVEIQQQKWISPPKEISIDYYFYAFEELPPLDYQTSFDNDDSKTSESFKCEEFNSGIVTNIYCCINSPTGDRYFKLSDVVSLSHKAIVSKVKASKAYT